MKEKFKTIILICLFLISIVLSKHLFFENFNSFASEKITEMESEESKIEENILMPYKALLNFSKRNHTEIYKTKLLWEESIDYIKEGLTNRNIVIEEITREEYQEHLDKRSIVYYFPQNINSLILSKSLDVEKVNNVIKDVQKFDYLYLSASDHDQFLIFTFKDKSYKVSNFKANIDKLILELNNLEIQKVSEDINEENSTYTNYYPLKDTMNINSILYIPYNMTEKYPYVFINEYLGNDILKVARENSEQFFNININFIREIIENNNSILHIYDGRVLKYTEEGIVEYFNPIQEEGQENLVLSFEKASEFLYKNINNSEDLHFSGYETVNYKDSKGYRFLFNSKIEGLELLDISEEDNRIYIDVYNNKVNGFRMRLDKNINIEYPEKEIMSGLDILNDNYDLFREDFINKNKIDKLSEEEITEEIYESFINMSLYYVYSEKGLDMLKPAWLLENKDYKYVFDIYNGELIKKIKI